MLSILILHHKKTLQISLKGYVLIGQRFTIPLAVSKGRQFVIWYDYWRKLNSKALHPEAVIANELIDIQWYEVLKCEWSNPIIEAPFRTKFLEKCFLVWDCFGVLMNGIKKVFCAALRAMTVPEWEGAVILFIIISKCEDTRIVAPFPKRYYSV